MSNLRDPSVDDDEEEDKDDVAVMPSIPTVDTQDSSSPQQGRPTTAGMLWPSGIPYNNWYPYAHVNGFLPSHHLRSVEGQGVGPSPHALVSPTGPVLKRPPMLKLPLPPRAKAASTTTKLQKPRKRKEIPDDDDDDGNYYDAASAFKKRTGGRTSGSKNWTGPETMQFVNTLKSLHPVPNLKVREEFGRVADAMNSKRDITALHNKWQKLVNEKSLTKGEMKGLSPEQCATLFRNVRKIDDRWTMKYGAVGSTALPRNLSKIPRRITSAAAGVYTPQKKRTNSLKQLMMKAVNMLPSEEEDSEEDSLKQLMMQAVNMLPSDEDFEEDDSDEEESEEEDSAPEEMGDEQQDEEAEQQQEERREMILRFEKIEKNQEEDRVRLEEIEKHHEKVMEQLSDISNVLRQLAQNQMDQKKE